MRKRRARLLAKTLAWVFSLGSLWPLTADLIWPLRFASSNTEDTYVLRAFVDGKQYTSWGLTYVGLAGYRLRLAELTGVLLAMMMSLMPWNTARRVGLLALVAWSALWFGNALRMAIIVPIHVFLLATLFSFIFFAATLARASMEWTRKKW